MMKHAASIALVVLASTHARAEVVTGTISPNILGSVTIPELGFGVGMIYDSGGGFTNVYLITGSDPFGSPLPGDNQIMSSPFPNRMYEVGENLLNGAPTSLLGIGSWANNAGKDESTVGEIGETLYLGFRVAEYLPDEQRYAYNYGFMQLLKIQPRTYLVEGYAYETEYDTDLTVFNIPAPSAAALLGLAGMTAMRRRR